MLGGSSTHIYRFELGDTAGDIQRRREEKEQREREDPEKQQRKERKR